MGTVSLSLGRGQQHFGTPGIIPPSVPTVKLQQISVARKIELPPGLECKFEERILNRVCVTTATTFATNNEPPHRFEGEGKMS